VDIQNHLAIALTMNLEGVIKSLPMDGQIAISFQDKTVHFAFRMLEE
jgi:hypothetical protein